MKKTFPHVFHTYDSGLRLIAVPMEGTKTVTVLVLVGTGSKYETKDINGISHFLEHMMFKGTTKRPEKLAISRELDSIGAEYNAFTSKEYTGYYAKASADKLDTLMDVVSDIFLNSKIEEDAIATEKGVIVEEINMYKDEPSRYVGDLFEELLYGDQPAGWDIAGNKETVTKLTRQQFVDYFNTHYVAENTVVAIAGNIKSEEIKEKTDRYFEHIRHSPLVTKLPVVESQDGPAIKIHYKKTDQTHFNLGFRGYNMFDERKHALSLIGVILGGGMSSRLFEEVRDKRGLAYYIRAGQQNYTDTGFFVIAGGLNNEKAMEALRVSLAEVDKLKREGVTELELRQAKDQVAGRMALSLEQSDAMAESFADPVLFEKKVLTPEEELDKIKKVSLDEILAVARDVFDERKLNFAVIGPFEDEQPFRDILHLNHND